MGVDVNNYDGVYVGVLLLAQMTHAMAPWRFALPFLICLCMYGSLCLFSFFFPSLLSLPHGHSSELSGTALSLSPHLLLVSLFPLLLHDGSVYLKPFCHAFLLLCRRTETIKNVGTKGCSIQVSAAFIQISSK
jgi:hypothetical protein